MGRALAAAFLDRGHPTTVWNRTAARADGLGARLASGVAEAVSAGPLVIVCMLDYAAARAILEPAAAALRGRAVVNLTADTPERARAMAGWAAAHGIDYLDGAIMTPVSTIGGPAALTFYSGPESVFLAHRATLSGLGGTVAYLGSDPGRAAAHDVALLDVFWTAMSGVAHAFALAAAERIAPADLARYARGIADLLPPIIDEYAGQIADGRYPGDDANLRSAAASMAHIVETAQAHGIDSGALQAVHAVARQAIDAGHGTDSFARLAQILAKGAA